MVAVAGREGEEQLQALWRRRRQRLAGGVNLPAWGSSGSGSDRQYGSMAAAEAAGLWQADGEAGGDGGGMVWRKGSGEPSLGSPAPEEAFNPIPGGRQAGGRRRAGRQPAPGSQYCGCDGRAVTSVTVTGRQ